MIWNAGDMQCAVGQWLMFGWPVVDVWLASG